MADPQEKWCYFDPYNWTEKDDEIADRLAGVGLGLWFDSYPEHPCVQQDSRSKDETMEVSMAMGLPQPDCDKSPDMTKMKTFAAHETCRQKTNHIVERTMAMEPPDVTDEDDNLPDETYWYERDCDTSSSLNSEEIAAMTIPKKKWKRLRRFLRSMCCCFKPRTAD